MNEEEQALQNASDENSAPEAEIEQEVEAQEGVFPEQYDPAQTYADDAGNEWKPNAEGEWEIVAVAESIADAPVAAVAPTTAQPYTPAAPMLSIPGMPAEMLERLNDLYVTNPAAAMQEQINYTLAQDRQAQAVASWQMEQRAAVAPEFYKVHGRAMEAHLATMPAERRVTEEAQLEAAAVAVYKEIQATKDPGAAFARAAALFNPQPAAKPKPPAAPPRLLAPSQRATAPTVAPNRDRPHVSNDMRLYTETYGLSPEEARKIINLQNKRG